MRRPDDLLVLDLAASGFQFRPGPPRLERTDADAYLVFELPPQSFGEQAFLQVAPNESFATAAGENVEVTSHPGYPNRNVVGQGEPTPAELPVSRIRMAGRSRIAVTMPADAASVPLTFAAMLGVLRDWPMRLDFNAKPDPSAIRFEGLLSNQVSEAAERLANRVAEAGSEHGMIEADFAREVTALGARFPALGGTAGATALATMTTRILTEAAEVVPDLSLKPWLPFIAGPREPRADATALELPYRILLSPLDPARWRHADQPVIHQGRTELWHSRLTNANESVGRDSPSRVRALWSPDYRPIEKLQELIDLISEQPQPEEGPQPNPDVLRMSLDPVDRSMLVTLMAGFDAERDNGRLYQPLSSEASRLHVSALGALLDAEGNWTTLPKGIDLEQWRHLATLGRDHYVRVVYKGYLYPFGHTASLVKVTERQFQPIASGSSERVALLRQRFFIVVRERLRKYNGSSHEHGGRDFPFTQIEILTRFTPDLTEPGIGKSALISPLPPGLLPRMLFWPMVPAPGTGATMDFKFELAAVDLAGERIAFGMPLLFVGKTADDMHGPSVRAAYNATPAAARRQAPFGAASLAYAPIDPAANFDPRLPTESVTFQAGKFVATRHPDVYPEIDVAEAGVKPIQKLLSQPGFVVELSYPDFYRTGGFASATNAGKIFLQLTRSKPLAFGGAPDQAKCDALGALASPQMELLGLSKTVGPVAGQSGNDAAAVRNALDTIRGGAFDPKDFFKDATILGGIPIADLLDIKHDLAAPDVPKMVTCELPDRVEASFDWVSEVSRSDELNLMIPHADPAKPTTRLTMRGVVRTPHAASAKAGFEANATLNNFKVNLFGFVIIWFEELAFSAKDGHKPDVMVELRGNQEAVRFGGPLEFVNELRHYIPSNGFSDPPALSVTPSGIKASFSLTLPAVQVGLFALSNASLGANFNLPFDSQPASVRFSFSERQAPFNLTVSLLGGGGFVTIGISSRGVTEIEAALEFGAAIAINLGVASGSVEVKAGIYFHWLEPIPNKGSVDLAGYVRIQGELTVIAIISVSLTFLLQLGYHKEGGRASVYGEATLIVEVEVLMFSAEVSVKCRREFAGGAADPKFIDLIPTQAVWDEYCNAFAAEAA